MLMQLSIAKFCLSRKQSFARRLHDNTGMKKEDVNQILARNLAAAMQRKYGQVNGSELARVSRVPQTTIALLLRPERRVPLKSGELPSPTLSKVAALAAALDVQVWELLHPDPDKAKREQDFYRRLERDFLHLSEKAVPSETNSVDEPQDRRTQARRAEDQERDRFGGVPIGESKTKLNR